MVMKKKYCLVGQREKVGQIKFDFLNEIAHPNETFCFEGYKAALLNIDTYRLLFFVVQQFANTLSKRHFPKNLYVKATLGEIADWFDTDFEGARKLAKDTMVSLLSFGVKYDASDEEYERFGRFHLLGASQLSVDEESKSGEVKVSINQKFAERLYELPAIQNPLELKKKIDEWLLQQEKVIEEYKDA